MKMLTPFWVVCALLMAVAPSRAADAKTLYENKFETTAVDSLPDGFLALEGDFKVKEAAGHKVLELPGAPAESYYGVLFGPATNWGVSVSARVFGTNKGRRLPSFGVGLNGGSGFRLRVSPSKQALELYHGEDLNTNAPFVWKSGAWTLLRLQVRASGGQSWKVEGKAWLEGTPEPADWMISWDESTAPPNGKASVWGTPYSGTPIWYDDLKVTGL